MVTFFKISEQYLKLINSYFNFRNIFSIVFLTIPLIFIKIFIYFHFFKITTKFSQKQEAILKIRPYFINNYKNFLKYFPTVFKVSLKFLLKLP